MAATVTLETPPLPETPPLEADYVPTNSDRLFDLAAEEAGSGSILIDGKQYEKCENLLSAPDFHDLRHRILCQVYKVLSKNGTAIEFLTVLDSLTRAGKLEAAGGESYLTFLLKRPASSQSAQSYARIIADYAARRRMFADASAMAREPWI